MTTLAEKNPTVMDRLIYNGFYNLVELCKQAERPVHLDRLLGTNNAASKWMRGECLPHSKIEAIAEQIVQVKAKPIMEGTEAEPKRPSEETLLVICPAEKLDKVEKVLALMGCETVAL